MKRVTRNLSALPLLCLCVGLGGIALAEELPEGVEQILERGKIAAILDRSS